MKYSKENFSVSKVLRDLHYVAGTGLDVSGRASFADKCAHSVNITSWMQIIPLLDGFARDFVPSDVRSFLLSKCTDFAGQQTSSVSDSQQMEVLAEHVVSRLAFKVITEPAFYAMCYVFGNTDDKLVRKIKRTSFRYKQYKDALERFYPQLFKAYIK